MGGEQQTGRRQDGIIRFRWLVLEHIQRGARKMAGGQRGAQGILIDQPSP